MNQLTDIFSLMLSFSLIDNMATEHGGAIAVEVPGAINISSAVFLRNSAADRGGAVDLAAPAAISVRHIILLIAITFILAFVGASWRSVLTLLVFCSVVRMRHFSLTLPDGEVLLIWLMTTSRLQLSVHHSSSRPRSPPTMHSLLAALW
jgi:hypothetical protein